eukprot:3996977-Pleurochrysis_carterae.AAC.2
MDPHSAHASANRPFSRERRIGPKFSRQFPTPTNLPPGTCFNCPVLTHLCTDATCLPTHPRAHIPSGSLAWPPFSTPTSLPAFLLGYLSTLSRPQVEHGVWLLTGQRIQKAASMTNWDYYEAQVRTLSRDPAII